MLAALRSGLGRLNLTLLGLTLLAATYWFTDQVTNRQPVAPSIDRAAVLAKRAARPSRPPVFYYIIDSLRYETATNPQIMPNLCALRAEGASARMMPGFNSATASSLRNAFTGRENAAVLAAVATFIHTDAGVESLFHQMALQGLTTAAYSAGFFHQFGAGITQEIEVGLRASHDVQDAHVLAAVDALRSGQFDLVFGHLLYTDATAHEEGVGTPRYLEAFHQADALLARIRARLPAGATLVVSGDHGHDLMGRHGIGLNVPTLGVYAGPLFRAGADLGDTSVMSHRYLLSQALGLPVTTEGYVGDLLPQALVSPPPVASSAPVAAEPDAYDRDRRIWPMWIYLSFLAAVWFNLLVVRSSPLAFTHGRSLALWLGVTPFFLHGTGQLVAAGTVTIVLGLALAWKISARQALLWLVLPASVGVAFQLWGRVLTVARPWLDQLPLAALAAYWLLVAVIGVILATRARRGALMAVIFAVAALVFHPVYHPYGFPGTLTPLMACWFLFYAVSLARTGALSQGAARSKLALLAVSLFLMLQPFAATGTNYGIFAGWHALVPAWAATNWHYLIIPAFAAKLLLYFPRRPAWTVLAPGLALIGVVQLMESRFWAPDFYARRGLALLMLAGWAAGTWWKRPEARLCGLTFLFVAYFSFVALTPRNFMETAAMLGGLLLCAQLVLWFPQEENTRTDYLFLALFGLMIAGWASMRWSGTELEWHAIFEWASEPTVEKHVGWFVPWIALKGLVPWVIILWALRERFSPRHALPAAGLLVAVGVKVITLLMITIGMGGSDTFNRNYLETACVVGALTMLYLGVIFLPRAWPAAAGAPSASPR
jgi:hypothetical protein